MWVNSTMIVEPVGTDASQLSLEGSSGLFVAKRLFHRTQSLTNRLTAVSNKQNTKELEYEVQRLYFTKFFLDWFMFVAKSRAVDVQTS